MLFCTGSKGRATAVKAVLGSHARFLWKQPQLQEETSTALLCWLGKAWWVSAGTCGFQQGCQGMQTSSFPPRQGMLCAMHRLGEVSSCINFLQCVSSVFIDNELTGKSFSRLNKRNSWEKRNPPGCCLLLFVDKLSTELQTTGTSNTLGNQQKVQHFLQSLVKRRGKAGSLA